MSRLRVALAGCGDISGVHLDAILADPEVEAVGVCDVHEGRRAAAAERAGCPGFADLTALLDAVGPDVVHVCTPHHLHAEMAAECLARDVSVLLEKPVAHTLADGERLARAAERSAGVLGVCFQNRYNDTARALRELLDRGELGRVLGGRASVTWFRDAAYYRSRDWRGRWATAGGGVLMNQAIHTLDLLQWYLGPVTDVRGTAATLALPGVIEVEDTAALRLRHRTASGDPVTSVFHATNGDIENAPVRVEISTELAGAPAGHRPHRDLPRRAGRGRPAGRVGGRGEGLLGPLARAAHRRLLPARPRGQALLDRRGRRVRDPAHHRRRLRPVPRPLPLS